MTDTKSAVEAAQGRLQMKAATVQRVLATADGKEMLEILKQEFLYEVRKESPHGPAFRLGHCDVLAYLEQLNKHGRS
jgi:hypothetical protein